MTNNAKTTPPDLKSSWYFQDDLYFSGATITTTKQGSRTTFFAQIPFPEFPEVTLPIKIEKGTKAGHKINEKGRLSGFVIDGKRTNTASKTIKNSRAKLYADAIHFHPGEPT